MSDIEVFGPYGNPREQANRRLPSDPHGLMPQQIEAMRDRMEEFLPQLADQYGSVHDVLGDILPEGATLSPGAGAGYRAAKRKHANVPGGGFGGAGGNTFQTPQRPYQPEFESPDRQQYPVHRILANRYWRLFYKLDPVIGNGIDMYSELPWGDVQFSGEGVDGEPKDVMEHSWDECQMRSVCPAATREFYVVGEAAPHLFWDDNQGCWTYCALHNPDQLEVINAPFIKMDPVVEFIPDQRLQQVLTSNHVMLRKVRETMPQELLVRLMARQNIPLSPVNFTFLPRKLHDYDVRGTSIISRMWRILMYEDAIYNASIATARRHAGPLKVAKLGNPQNGWIPGPEHERRLLEMLAQAELDVNAWLVYHYAINFELVGTTERVMSIDKHHEIIERIKLIALGISKAFLHGEVTYASAASGLTVFLQRLKALREYFEAQWLIPKFFLQMAKINKWVKPTQAELSNRVRIRRSSKELAEDRRYIVPTLEWGRSLDPAVDSEMISAMGALTDLGVQFSKNTLYSLVGRDFEEESKQRVRDYETEKQIYKDYPELMMPANAEGGGGGALPGGGGGVMPPMDPESFGDLAPGGGEPAAPGSGGDDLGGEMPEASATAADDPKPTRPDPFAERERIGPWTKSDLEDIMAVLDGEVPDDEPWISAIKDPDVRDALKTGDRDEIWEALKEFLAGEDFPARQVNMLDDILNKRKASVSTRNSKGLEERRKEAQLLDMIDDYGSVDSLVRGP